ncbi:hypothetical protein B0I35DRAFT_480024 [Stachybotrys elegans]|uniref:Uncharacterized protein n=1 Tax=Stachybotrys elegans TaxID=80388 RepID=A0A8K0SIE7_9HYPO|nr:hypothetical protein B0I35DRAFT_480024 [Stachybotrys elegans]
MSEVGIEQDALMHTSLINPMEDDLITYESDVEGQSRDLQGAKPIASMPETKQNYGADSENQDGDEQGANTADDFAFEKTEENFEDNETNDHDVDQHDLNPNDLDTYAEIEIEEHTAEYIEDEDPSNSHQPADKEDDDYMQELDYGHDDATGELPNDGIDHADSGVYDQVQDDENREASTQDAEQDSVPSNSAGEAQADPSVPTEEDEITWDEAEPENQHDASLEAAHGMSPDTAQPEASEVSSREAVGEGGEAQNVVEEEVAEEAYEPENDDVHEIDYDEEPTLTELQGEEADVEDQVDEVDSRQVSVKEEESSHPAITVQYRGDEFPFFSDTSDGFFSELSVLDDSMESLLAGFRSELANEIPPEEELVFQIDELGLEFAESQTQDTVSGITLRQILEVFDLLVKNQDPDSSRVLYTYLFTRPTTSKRFDFLVESATAGKGLDEVIHLFGSPMPQGTANLIADSQAADDYHESLDNYESGLEEHHSTEDQTEASGGEDDQDQLNAQDENLEVLDEGATGGEDNVEGSMASSHEIIQADAEAVPEVTQETEEASVTKLDMIEVVDTVGDSDHYMLHESDHIEVSQPAEAGLDLENQGDTNFAEADVAYGMESTSTHDTGTTGTMLDDDANVDLTAQAELPATTPTAHGDDMDEIDWREEPEVDVEGITEADADFDTPNASVKRSRTEDEEVDLEEDKDVKRRRS